MSLSSATRQAGRQITSNVGIQRARRPLFFALLIAFLAFLVFALWESMLMVVNGWLPGYIEPTHRVHHIMIGGTLTVFLLTIAVQLYRPIHRIGAMQAALIFVISIMVLTALVSGIAAASELLIFVLPVVVLALLHPGVREIRPRLADVNRRLLAIALIGGSALAYLAVMEFNAHVTLTNDHVAFGHYEFMIIALVCIALFAVIGAFRSPGWRVPIYAAAALALLYGISSLTFPGAEQGSSLSTIGSIGVMAWAVILVTVAEYDWRERDK